MTTPKELRDREAFFRDIEEKTGIKVKPFFTPQIPLEEEEKEEEMYEVDEGYYVASYPVPSMSVSEVLDEILNSKMFIEPTEIMKVPNMMSYYDKTSEEIVGITWTEGDITISTVKSLPMDTRYGAYHTAITKYGVRTIAEGYANKELAIIGHKSFLEMSYRELWSYKCIGVSSGRNQSPSDIIITEVTKDKLIEIHRDREFQEKESARAWREAREAEELEKEAKKIEKLKLQILKALTKNPHDMLLFIGNKNKVEDNIENIVDEFFYFPCELVGIEQVIEILNENEDEIYKNEDNREVINELKFAFSVHGNNMSVIFKGDF